MESCSLLSDLRGEDEVPKMSSRAWEGLKVVVSRPAGLLRLKVNLPTVALVEEVEPPAEVEPPVTVVEEPSDWW